MTTTLSILNLGDSVSVDVAALDAVDKSLFAVVDSNMDDGTRETVYQKVTGSAEYPMSARIGRYVNAAAHDGVGKTNTSIKIDSFLQKDVDGTVVYTLPCSGTIALNMPGISGIPDKAGVVELISNLVTWALSVEAGVVTDDHLDDLEFGVVNNALAHVNSHS
jgi:hypothetical protein